MRLLVFVLVNVSFLPVIHSSDPTLGTWTSPPHSVPSDKTVDGPLLGNGDIGVVVGGTTNSLGFYIGKNDFWYFGNQNQKYGKKIVGLGGIMFTLKNNNNNNNNIYQLEQHSDKGYVTFNLSSIITGNATVSQYSNILIINFNNFDSNNIHYSLFCWNTSSSATTYTSNTLNNWCRRDTTSNVLFVSAAIALNITINKNIFILSIVSNFDINNNSTDVIVSTAQNMSANLVSNPSIINEIWINNNKWFNLFWNLSSITIDSESLIIEYWYKSLYIQGISNRINKIAPGLWGPFVTVDEPAWNGDYTLNYNFEAPYYGIYSSNHINISYPYYKTILNYTQQGIIDAEYYYNCSNAIHYPGHITPFGYNNSGDMGQHSDASFAALNFINHFKYTQDINFLTNNNNEIYNFLVLIGNWWICWLDRYENVTQHIYIDNNDCTRENCYPSSPPNCTNPAISLSFIKFIFSNLINITNIMQINNNLIDKYEDIINHLSLIPTGIYNKYSVLLPQESPYYFKPGDNPLQLYGIYPGEQIGIGSDMQEIGINTVGMVASWEQGNSYCEMYPSAIRVGYNINETLLQWNNLLKKHMPQNGYVSMGGGGMDSSGAIIAVNEMVLQSWNNIIKLFPVYNFGNASFISLRAVGAFLISAKMINSNIISPVIIYSEKGINCTIEIPWILNNTKVCKVDNDQCTQQIPLQCNANICKFNTVESTSYQLYKSPT